jgi:hypothetical protein
MNRHSLLPTTSDDSGNESSVNYQQPITNNTHFVVVAIDFGTTFSGYAFAFTRDIDSILMMRKVDGNDPGSFLSLVAFFFLYQYLLFVSVVLIGVINQKTPTTILLTPNLEFHSFGFFARDFFHDLDPDEAKRWLYFEKFKMHLHYTQVRIYLFFLTIRILQQTRDLFYRLESLCKKIATFIYTHSIDHLLHHQDSCDIN